MKKKMMFSIAILVVVSLIVVACAGNSASESASPTPPSPQPTPINNPTETVETAEATADDIKARIAGFWRMDWPNPHNAAIMILFADGRWESPGPLPTDHTNEGSFIIANEESGIYQLKFTVEQSTSPHAEVGHEFDNYFYDAQNDLLFSVSGSGEGYHNVEFIREHDLASLYENLFAIGSDALTYAKVDTDAGNEYRFERLGFAFILPHPWSDMYEVGGDDVGHTGDGNNGYVTVDFRVMDISMRLFWIQRYDAEVWGIEDWDVIRTFNVDNVEYMMVANSWRRSAIREHDWIGDFRDTVEIMLDETDTIVADSIRGL